MFCEDNAFKAQRDMFFTEMFELACHCYYIELIAEKEERTLRFSKFIAYILSSRSNPISSISCNSSFYNAKMAFEQILIDAEEFWFDIENKKISSEEISAYRLNIKRKKADVINDQLLLSGNHIPSITKLQAESEKKARIYFENYYKNELV